MGLNLVQFQDVAKTQEISAQLHDEVVLVALDSGVPPPKPWPATKDYKAKFHSCAVILKNDSNALQKARKAFDFVAVRGSSPEMCSWAANSKGVDLLLQPFSLEKCFLDLQTANTLRDNGVFVCVLFNEFLAADGFRLSQFMKNAAMCVRLCGSAGTKMLFAGGAKNEFQMRASRDLASFAVMLGVGKGDALSASESCAEELLGRLK